MKIEMLDDEYKIFVNPEFLGDINWEDKEEVINKITNFFKSIINHYPISLDGFYKVSVYPSNVGVIIHVILIDDYSYNEKGLDFRIVVYLNKDIYFKTDDFDVVCDYANIYYDDEFFYILIDDVYDDFIRLCEFGEIVVDKGNLVIKQLKKD